MPIVVRTVVAIVPVLSKFIASISATARTIESDHNPILPTRRIEAKGVVNPSTSTSNGADNSS